MFSVMVLLSISISVRFRLILQLNGKQEVFVARRQLTMDAPDIRMLSIESGSSLFLRAASCIGKAGFHASDLPNSQLAIPVPSGVP